MVAPAAQTAAPTSCRQVSTLIGRSGYAFRTAATNVSRALDLLRDVDLVPRSRFHAADVDDVGTVADDVVHPLHARHRRRKSHRGRRTSRACD